MDCAWIMPPKTKKTLTLLLACTSRLSDRIKSHFHHHQHHHPQQAIEQATALCGCMYIVYVTCANKQTNERAISSHVFYVFFFLVCWQCQSIAIRRCVRSHTYAMAVGFKNWSSETIAYLHRLSRCCCCSFFLYAQRFVVPFVFFPNILRTKVFNIAFLPLFSFSLSSTPFCMRIIVVLSVHVHTYRTHIFELLSKRAILPVLTAQRI